MKFVFELFALHMKKHENKKNSKQICKLSAAIYLPPTARSHSPKFVAFYNFLA